MIYSLRGMLLFTDPSSAVIECAGVGYKCAVTVHTLRQLPKIGSEAKVFTYMNVREDAVDLFGFATEDELASFKLLIAVNGVGPKAALAILSELAPEKLAFAVAGGDVKAITRAQGVGPKLAQRIVLELKDRVMPGNAPAEADGSGAVLEESSDLAQAVSALVALGYAQSEAASAVAKTDTSQPVEQIIKDALKYLF